MKGLNVRPERHRDPPQARPTAMICRAPWRWAALVAFIPAAITLTMFSARTHLFPIAGDEPHYLIIADSLLSDFDLNLQNNYERDAQRSMARSTRTSIGSPVAGCRITVPACRC